MAMLNRLGVLAVVFLTAGSFGCNSKPSQETATSAAAKPRTEAKRTSDKMIAAQEDESVTPTESPKKVDATAHRKTTVRKKKPQAPVVVAPLTMPKVAMTDEIRTACLIKVGDVMPLAELQGVAGKSQALESLAGPKATVVCFWTAASVRQRLATIAMLEELTQDVVEPFGKRGVGVVAINVGNSAADAREDVKKAKVTFPCLLDLKGELFAKVAKDHRMPRVYLLDAEGKILWFDVEYSRSTREGLTQAVRVALGER